MARVFLFALIGMFCTLWAHNADAITLSEKRVTLTPDTPSIDITITSDFDYENEHTLSFVNHAMDENGVITAASADNTDVHWAAKHLSLSQNKLVLKPNEKATVTLTANFDELHNAVHSEYRTHLFVRALHAPESRAKASAKIDIDMSVGIPVYLQLDAKTPETQVANASFQKHDSVETQYSITAEVTRKAGNTVYGDLNLYCVGENEKRLSETPFSTAYGLSIYPEIKTIVVIL